VIHIIGTLGLGFTPSPSATYGYLASHHLAEAARQTSPRPVPSKLRVVGIGLAVGFEGDVALTGELDGVGQQIEQTLAHLELVGMHRTQSRRTLDLQCVGIFLDHRPDRGSNLINRLGQVEGFQK
jgi:hypothetical protein